MSGLPNELPTPDREEETPEESEVRRRQQEPVGTGLVFARDYYPGRTFQILGRLPASLTVKMLGGPLGRRVAVISQPDEYDGYVIQYEEGRASIYTFLFSRQVLDSAASYRIGPDATYFSSLLNLLEAPLVRVESEG